MKYVKSAISETENLKSKTSATPAAERTRPTERVPTRVRYEAFPASRLELAMATEAAPMIEGEAAPVELLLEEEDDDVFSFLLVEPDGYFGTTGVVREGNFQ